MAKKEKPAVGLDIGSYKVACVIAKPDDSSQKLNVLGVGMTKARGVQKGAVIDLAGACDSIAEAVNKAEEQAKQKIHSVFINMPGSHVRGLNTRGTIAVTDKEHMISKLDIEKVLDDAKGLAMSFDRDIIQSTLQNFIVDGQLEVENPVGMFADKLEVDLHVISGQISFMNNIKKALRQAGFDLEGVVAGGYATSFSVLTEHQKDIGVILIDIGAATTEIAIFTDGIMRFFDVLPIGGDSLTESISKFCKIPPDQAQDIKERYGTCGISVKEDEEIIVRNHPAEKTISRAKFCQLQEEKTKQLLGIIKKRLSSSHFADQASSGIVIVGQTALMDGLLELAEGILNFPVRLGEVKDVLGGPPESMSLPYITAVGLAKYGIRQRQQKTSAIITGTNFITRFIAKARELYRDYF